MAPFAKQLEYIRGKDTYNGLETPPQTHTESQNCAAAGNGSDYGMVSEYEGGKCYEDKKRGNRNCGDLTDYCMHFQISATQQQQHEWEKRP